MLIRPNQVGVIAQIRSQVHVPNQVHINPLLCQVLLIIPFGYNTILKPLFIFYYFDHFMQNFQLNWNSLLQFIIISHLFFPFQSYFSLATHLFHFTLLFHPTIYHQCNKIHHGTILIWSIQWLFVLNYFFSIQLSFPMQLYVVNATKSTMEQFLFGFSMGQSTIKSTKMRKFIGRDSNLVCQFNDRLC